MCLNAAVRLAPGASFNQTILTSGARRQRIETQVQHPGQGASVRLDGAYHHADQRHADLTTLVPPADDRPVSPDKVERLLARARREVDQGLAPAVQIAVARHGRLVVDATFGAPDTSRFVVFSATKALVAAALWRLIDQGLVRVEEPCATYVPEFGTNGKEVVTVEHVLTHTGGFPFAPLGPPRWSTREGRLEAFSRWSLTLEPGTTFLYHPTSGHWILAEIITAVTGLDHADAIEQLVTAPLGLGRLLGIPLDQQQGIIDAVPTGERPTPAEMASA